jgi:hypothetical protein
VGGRVRDGKRRVRGKGLCCEWTGLADAEYPALITSSGVGVCLVRGGSGESSVPRIVHEKLGWIESLNLGKAPCTFISLVMGERCNGLYDRFI